MNSPDKVRAALTAAIQDPPDAIPAIAAQMLPLIGQQVIAMVPDDAGALDDGLAELAAYVLDMRSDDAALLVTIVADHDPFRGPELTP